MENKSIKYFIYDDCNKIFLNKLFLKDYKIFNFRKLLIPNLKDYFF